MTGSLSASALAPIWIPVRQVLSISLVFIIITIIVAVAVVVVISIITIIIIIIIIVIIITIITIIIVIIIIIIIIIFIIMKLKPHGFVTYQQHLVWVLDCRMLEIKHQQPYFFWQLIVESCKKGILNTCTYIFFFNLRYYVSKRCWKMWTGS